MLWIVYLVVNKRIRRVLGADHCLATFQADRIGIILKFYTLEQVIDKAKKLSARATLSC